MPFLTTTKGDYDEPPASPPCATLDMLDLYEHSPSVYLSSTRTDYKALQPTSSLKSSTLKLPSQFLPPHTAYTFSDYSPCDATPANARKTYDNEDQMSMPRQRADSKHQARLSRSLSSPHALAKELVPSPLFSRGPSSKKESLTMSVTSVGPLPLVGFSKPLPPTPISRPLPALPFNHKPQFVLKGKRFIIAPPRKTALATLISQFEGQSPFDSPESGTLSGKDFVLYRPTPTTERFKRISATFDTKEEDKENVAPDENQADAADSEDAYLGTSTLLGSNDSQDQGVPPVTPCPRAARVTARLQHSASRALNEKPNVTAASHDSCLVAYNGHLSSFRTSLLNHISTVNNRITEVRSIQTAHEDEKRRKFADMHNRRWSAIPEPASPSRNEHRDSRLAPAKDARLRSFWSLQIADAQSRKDGSGPTWADEEKAKERKERIQRLKADGWKGVRKEAKGWKGSEHYEALRARVEQELAC